jgi:hypothetical protein
MEVVDNAADGLEDAAFLVDLGKLHGKPLDALVALADLLAEASQEWIKAVGHATQIGLAASALETEDFLAAIDRLGSLERQADKAELALTGTAIEAQRHIQGCTNRSCNLESFSLEQPQTLHPLKRVFLFGHAHTVTSTDRIVVVGTSITSATLGFYFRRKSHRVYF